MFSNLLQLHITFAVPRLHLQALRALLDSIVITDQQQYALIVFTSFRLRESAVSGYLVIVLGVGSLESLLQAIETLG
jgi:chemotaxis protein CheC